MASPLSITKDGAREHLLHGMHDASKFAEGTTKAILEGMLHSYEYGDRVPPYRGNKCCCPHCGPFNSEPDEDH